MFSSPRVFNMVHKILAFALFCVSLNLANSAHLRNTVVDFEREGETFRGNLHVNGKAYPLKLKRPVDSVFAPNFRMTETIRSPSGKITLREIPMPKHVSELERNIYVDEDANATFIVDHVDGEMRLQGTMDNIHISHDGQDHVASVQEFPSKGFKTDYLSTRRALTRDGSVDNRQVTVASPELFFTIDNQHFTDLGRDATKLPEYLSIMVRGVNNRYKTVSDPSITFKIVGSTIIESVEAQPFIEESKGSDGTCGIISTLNKFSAYMYTLRQTNKDLPQHDLAPLLSGEQFDNEGVAWTAGACQDNNNKLHSQRVSIIRDRKAGWVGLHALAHELAHSMGAPHDGNVSEPNDAYKFDTTSCPWTDSYIMSYLWENPLNQLTFSSCSISYMKAFINTKEGSCLRNDDGPEAWPEAPKDPGWFVSIDEQCAKTVTSCANSTAATTHYVGDQLCDQLKCVCFGKLVEPAARPHDGTPCDKKGGRCQEGKCVA